MNSVIDMRNIQPGTPVISIICLSYNHDKYIRRCLDSILEQTVSVPIEIVVHDDASNDNSQAIIREYYARYPDKIVPVIETENKYSKGYDVIALAGERIQGKYVAYCECDDWWADKNKLEVQYRYMEEHPECSLCVHAVAEYNDEINRYVGSIGPANTARDYSVKEIIEGDGGMFGTNSMFHRANDFNMPSYYYGWGVGDYPRTIFLATRGYVHFDPAIMSVWRRFSSGSWSEKMRNVDYSVTIRRRIIEGLIELDNNTNGKYHDSISDRVSVFRLEILASTRDVELFQALRRSDLALPSKTRLVLECIAPVTVPILQRVRDFLKSVFCRQTIS